MSTVAPVKTGLIAVAFVLAACTRPQIAPVLVDAPLLVDAAPDRPAPAPAPAIKDAGIDAVDAAPDVAAPRRPSGHHAPDGVRGGSGGFKIEGALSKPEAEKTLASGKAKLRGCYDREHAKNAALRGKVSFRLTVDDRGRVTLGEVVTSTLGGGDPEMCMIEALRDLKFAPPPGGGESKLSFQMAFGR
jgi:hypothetical protein